MSASVGRFRAAYAAALGRHLDEPSETALRAAYELGRDAVADSLSVLDLAAAHHDALAIAIRTDPDVDRLEHVTQLAGGFYLESLAAFEMVQRGFREAREAAQLEQRHAALLRQLSNLLADASLAFDATGSRHEMLRLVAEQALELTGARRCRVTAMVEGRSRPLEVISTSSEETDPPFDERGSLAAPLTALDGREFGSIEVADREEGDFREIDEAVLMHVARMASAAFERTQHYVR